MTALTAAASGNISGATGEFIQRGLVNWAQANVAGGIKQLAEDYGIAEGTPAHAALHAVSSCVGAGAAGANCGTAAVAAAGATLISSLLSAQDNDALSNEQKETRAALVQTLIVGAAVAAGAQADVANTAALIELENNSNVRKAVDDALKKAKDFVSKNGEKGLESVGNLLEKLEVKTLVEKQELIKRFLNDAAGKGNLTEPQIVALAILYAANEVLFPTNVLDLAPGAGKAIAKAGDLIKLGVRAEGAVKIASATQAAGQGVHIKEAQSVAATAHGANATSPLTAPVSNPAGAARAEKFSEFQQKVSAKETIARIAGDNPVITYTASGKTLYTNPTTGKQVVYDNAGKYFRVEDTAVSGPLRYTDQFGNTIPNNVPLIKNSGTSKTGVPADIRKALTHFTDSD